MSTLLDLCALPDIQDNILKQLGLRDIKALRLTCQETCDWVDGSSVKNQWGGVSATIDLRERADGELQLKFKALAALPFAVYELKLVNYSDPRLLNVEVTGEFLKVKGAGVKKIHMSDFFGCRAADEMAFFEGLSGLEEMYADTLRVDPKYRWSRANPHIFPAAIRNLRNLEVKSYYGMNTAVLREVICAPRFTRTLKLPLDRNMSPVFIHVNQILQCLRDRRVLTKGTKTNYTHVDLTGLEAVSFWEPTLNDVSMRWFFVDCRRHSVKVVNVNPLMIIRYSSFLERTTFIEGTVEVVESISGWHSSLQELRSTTLKELRISSTGHSLEKSRVPEKKEVEETYSWPNLELLQVTFKMNFDSAKDRSCCTEIVRALHLGPHCLPNSSLNVSGLKVAELELNFPRKRDETDESMAPDGVICPSSIVEHYPNVKILKITGWDAEDPCWIQLWKGLLQLEEVQIADCRKLGDKGFISDRSTEQSPFLKLRNLKKLTLKDLPKITDQLFREVIAELPLEEFYLHTEKSWSNTKVSHQALEYLAKGAFASSVKKFPLDNIVALKNTTDEELQQLKFRFPRAYF